MEVAKLSAPPNLQVRSVSCNESAIKRWLSSELEETVFSLTHELFMTQHHTVTLMLKTSKLICTDNMAHKTFQQWIPKSTVYYPDHNSVMRNKYLHTKLSISHHIFKLMLWACHISLALIIWPYKNLWMFKDMNISRCVEVTTDILNMFWRWKPQYVASILAISMKFYIYIHVYSICNSYKPNARFVCDL